MSKFRHPIASAVLAGSGLVAAGGLAFGVAHEVNTEDRRFSVEIGGAEIWFDKTRAISFLIAGGGLAVGICDVVYMHDERKHGQPSNNGQSSQ